MGGIKLGMNVRDSITGLVGIVTIIATYLANADSAEVSPPLDRDGKFVAPQWFSIERLVEVPAAGSYEAELSKPAHVPGLYLTGDTTP